MLKSKRMFCGLGNPPEPFYTNDVESQNSVIKHQTQYKAKELPDFVSTMQTMITNQKQEIEKSVAGCGEYQIVDEYKHLQVASRKFCQMTRKQKEKHVKHFFSAPVVSCEDQVDGDPISEEIWKEAERLNDNPSNICLSPGCTNDREWLVKSGEEKHRQPYFVECKPSGQILCEKTCALYLSSKVCAHTVAVACHTSTMDKYLSWVQKQKDSVSLSALANLNMPKGAGKNPNTHRKASHKSSTKRIKAILSQADQLTPRIKVA